MQQLSDERFRNSLTMTSDQEQKQLADASFAAGPKRSSLLGWPKVMQPDHQRCFASALPSRHHHTKIYRQSFSWQVLADFLNSKQAMFLIMFLRMMFLEKRLPETRIVDVCKDGDADSGAWRGQRFDEVPPAFEVLAQHQVGGLANHGTAETKQKTITETDFKNSSIPNRCNKCHFGLLSVEKETLLL